VQLKKRFDFLGSLDTISPGREMSLELATHIRPVIVRALIMRCAVNRELEPVFISLYGKVL
jgi:hypothetical protein